MDGSCATPSAQLLEANRRLHALREQLQGHHQIGVSADLLWKTGVVSGCDPAKEMLSILPRHLGWGSAPLTAVLRRRQTPHDVAYDQTWLQALREDCQVMPSSSQNLDEQSPDPSFISSDIKPTSNTVKLYPDIGLGMLRQEMTASGRLWMMLRYLDKDGRGVLRIANTTSTLTPKSSKLRLCGKRQLRNLLHDGEGVFWTRDKERVWLHSAAKVAYALAVEGLKGRPVALPVAALTDGIGAFRAHLYAAFHSGRMKVTPQGRQTAPIARDTLAGLSGVGRSSQRNYEARVGLTVRANFAVGQVVTKENQEKQAWQQGQACFELKDYRGQQGKKGKSYLAWQLPNSYSGQHQTRPKGRQKRINCELNDLVMKGMPGNVVGTDETHKLEKTYFPNGKLAAKAHGRDPEQDLYWKRGRTRNGRFGLWQHWCGE